MVEKYIDLTEEIWRADEGRTSFGSVSMVLAYLDEHPERVPGRTITESQIAEAFGDEYHYWAKRRLSRIGITVVPDPEPTNADKLEQLHQNWSQSDRNPPFGEWADSVGILAPEDWADDD